MNSLVLTMNVCILKIKCLFTPIIHDMRSKRRDIHHLIHA